MQKMMFNDEWSLTRKVIEELKTLTRRAMKIQPKGNLVSGINFTKSKKNTDVYHKFNFDCGTSIVAPYREGEIVAVSQSYWDIYFALGETDIQPFLDKLVNSYPMNFDRVLLAAWKNKMFVKAELMPNQIKILSIRPERLQDISEEDCLKEGIYDRLGTEAIETYSYGECDYSTPQRAFASLMDKISGKGTWNSNPWVWRIEFELIKSIT